MAEKLVRFYTCRDDIMLDKADAMHHSFTVDEAQFSSFSAVMFPATFSNSFLGKITTARNFDRDNVVIDEQVEDTTLTDAKVKECGDYFQAMKPIVEFAFPNQKAVWNQFGFNDYEKARKSQGKMQLFMESLHNTSVKYQTELLAAGFTAAKIAECETLAGELRALETQQEFMKKDRVVITQQRITNYNAVWEDMQLINKASKAIFMNDYAKLNEYELPRNSNAGNEVIKGTVEPAQIANIVVMEFTDAISIQIKNTGEVPLWFGLAPDEFQKNDAVEVTAGASTTAAASSFGDLANQYLNVHNPKDIQGSYEVKIVF